MGNHGPLAAIDFRLGRAYGHLEAVNALIDAFTDQEPKTYGAVIEDDNKTGDKILRGWVDDEPPALAWAPVIGDALHNLRSILDHLAWKLGGDPPPNEKTSEFPIFDERDAFRGTIKGGPRSGYDKIVGIECRAQAVIEDVQPYHRGQAAQSDPLWLLHCLSAMDKHRAPHLSVALAEGAVRGQIDESTGHVHIGLSDLGGALRVGAFEHGHELGRWHPGYFTPEPKSADDLHLVFGIAFDPKGPAAGAPVKDSLWAMWRSVNDVLARLAPFV